MSPFIVIFNELVLNRDSNIDVQDFGPSWRDGILFLNIINTIRSNLVDIKAMRSVSNRQRLETAFTVAEQDLGISRLLDPEVSFLLIIFFFMAFLTSHFTYT